MGRVRRRRVYHEVQLCDPRPVTDSLVSQLDWYILNCDDDTDHFDIMLHTIKLSEGKGLGGLGMFTANVSDPSCTRASKTIAMTASEHEEYLKDREGYVARYFGLTVPEYHEWNRLDGRCLCGGISTLSGNPCKNGVSDKHLSASEWKARHRVGRCWSHQEEQLKPAA